MGAHGVLLNSRVETNGLKDTAFDLQTYPESTSWDGAQLLAALTAAARWLEAHADEVNALNVFPVPDGDTGTNMVATARAALEEAERAGREVPVERMAAAISHGALMGARGNSGVITSQILRGLAEASPASGG